jgi:hypothetical protein
VGQFVGDVVARGGTNKNSGGQIPNVWGLNDGLKSVAALFSTGLAHQNSPKLPHGV